MDEWDDTFDRYTDRGLPEWFDNIEDDEFEDYDSDDEPPDYDDCEEYEEQE